MANSKYVSLFSVIIFGLFVSCVWLTIFFHRYEYVKQFEQPDGLLPNAWIVVRIDGRGFHKYVLFILLSLSCFFFRCLGVGRSYFAGDLVFYFLSGVAAHQRVFFRILVTCTFLVITFTSLYRTNCLCLVENFSFLLSLISSSIAFL